MTADDSTSTGGTASRRTFLKVAGTGVALTGLAGCVGSENGDGGDTPTDASTPEPTSMGTATGTPTPSGPDTVLIGQPAALTGQWDFLQPAVSQSTDLAAQEINDAGGPLDADFEVQRRDTAP